MADIIMPRLSDTMEEGTIARWLKQPGDQVSRGEVIAEIDTDKATMDLEAYEDGVLERILVGEGSTAPIGQAIASLAGPGGAPAPAATVARAPASEPAPAAPAPSVAPENPAASLGTSDRPVAPTSSPLSSPLARSLARRHGLEIANIVGSGPGGRVVRADVEAAIGDGRAAVAAMPTPGPLATPSSGAERAGDDVEIVPLGNLRRRTAERLSISAQVPHFSLTSVVDAERLVAFRGEVNRGLDDSTKKISVTDLLVKACATVLRGNPEINSSWDGDKLLRYRRINIGLAVAVPDGLAVPVVHDADRKSVREISAESRALAERARQGKLSLNDIGGGTFTISNLGMFGIDQFTAVLNPPQAAILAVGAARSEPIVRDGAVVAGTTMKLTLSVDHRVLDGATAATFLAELCATLENPLRIVV